MVTCYATELLDLHVHRCSRDGAPPGQRVRASVSFGSDPMEIHNIKLIPSDEQ